MSSLSYGSSWLNSCLAETSLPHTSWLRLRELVVTKLSLYVEPYLDRPELRQMIFDLLGNDFVKRFVKKWPDEPQRLEPPFMEPSRRRETETLARRTLNRLLTRISTEIPEARDDFKAFARDMVSDKVDRELVMVQEKEGKTYSETLGFALGHLLDQHPRHLNRVCSQLKGRLLPESLRSKVWMLTIDVMVGKLEKHKKDYNQRCREFADSISSHRCLISGLIRKSVEKALIGSTEAERDTCCQVLDILYRFNKSYEPAYAYIAFPVVQALADSCDLLTVAWMFSEIILYCFFSSATIDVIASGVIEKIKKCDSELFDHLADHYKSASAAFAERTSIQVYSGPIKKWITQGFVDVLSGSSLVFAWDQLFLHSWNPVCMEQLCLAIVILLKSDLMKAKSSEELYGAFFISKIDLRTLRAAWMQRQEKLMSK